MLQVVTVDPVHPPADRIERARAVVEAGGIVALPTETFYGLSADALDAAALERLNRLKGKPADSPVLLLAADTAQVLQVAADLPEPFTRLAERFWPGPLTLVVPAAPGLPPQISGGRETVGVRVPGLALPRRLAAALGRPITGISANAHGKPPARTAAEVARMFAAGVEMVLDGGPTPGGAPSTILDLSGPRPRVLREGQVPASALRPFLSGLRGSSL